MERRTTGREQGQKALQVLPKLQKRRRLLTPTLQTCDQMPAQRQMLQTRMPLPAPSRSNVRQRENGEEHREYPDEK